MSGEDSAPRNFPCTESCEVYANDKPAPRWDGRPRWNHTVRQEHPISARTKCPCLFRDGRLFRHVEQYMCRTRTVSQAHLYDSGVSNSPPASKYRHPVDTPTILASGNCCNVPPRTLLLLPQLLPLRRLRLSPTVHAGQSPARIGNDHHGMIHLECRDRPACAHARARPPASEDSNCLPATHPGVNEVVWLASDGSMEPVIRTTTTHSRHTSLIRQYHSRTQPPGMKVESQRGTGQEAHLRPHPDAAA